MSLYLLMPLGLAALAAWLVPLLIHLVRRPERTPYDFPAMRWLRESERPRRRLRLEDLGLLLLRLLLLALIAMLLAVPMLQGEWRGARHWVLVSSAVDVDAVRMEPADAEWRWLAPGFPDIKDARPASDQPLASLVREFEAGLPPSDTLTVLVTDQPAGLDAERIALGRAIEWKVVGALASGERGADSRKPLKIALRHSGEEDDALRYMRAALAALGVDAPDSLQVDDKPASVPLEATSDALIWLGEKLPDELLPWIESGGRALVVDPQARAGSVVLRDEKGNAVASEQVVGAGAIVRLLHALTPGSIPMLLDADFPAHLHLLLEGAAPPPTSAIAAEVAPIHVDRETQSSTTPLSGLLCLLVAIVFLLERIVAMRRRQPA